MNLNMTYVGIVLDRSGSMASIRDATIDGFNNFIDKLREDSGECQVRLWQFDDEYEAVFDCPLRMVRPLTRRLFTPRDNTALLGAQGRTIETVGAELAARPESGRPGKVILVTITDGYENASHRHEWSRQYTVDRVSGMVRHQREKYGWEFIYLGANQDAISTAAQYGFTRGSTMTYAANYAGTTNAYGSVGMHVNSLRSATRSGVTGQSVGFTDEDRAAAVEDEQPSVPSHP